LKKKGNLPEFSRKFDILVILKNLSKSLKKSKKSQKRGIFERF